MQRDAIIDLMNDPVAQELVKAPIHARLAYCARDGSPRVIPVGYIWNGEVFAIGSPVNSPKVKALAANPKVGLTVDTESFPPHVLLVRGEAAVEIVDGVPDEFIEASRRFIGEGGMLDPNGKSASGPCTRRWRSSVSCPPGPRFSISRPACRVRSRS